MSTKPSDPLWQVARSGRGTRVRHSELSAARSFAADWHLVSPQHHDQEARCVEERCAGVITIAALACGTEPFELASSYTVSTVEGTAPPRPPMTESAGRWLAREVLVLVGLYGLLLSAALYALGLGLASVDVIIAVTGQQLPALLATGGRWGLIVVMAGEGVLLVSGWLLRQGTRSHDGQVGDQRGKDAA